jgi:DNA-binding NtrC family response regulator
MDEEKKLKLLIIDDEEGIVEWVQKIYKRKGFQTFGVTDGIAAVEIFEKERPEITLIDVHMPYSPIDGVETLERIKRIDKNAICIMVTRIVDQDKVEASRKLGALHYLKKPLAAEALDRVVMEAKELALKAK